MVMGCPYEGEVEPSKVSDVTKQLFDLGCYEVSLGDTVGKGTPEKTVKLIEELKKSFPAEKLAVHFHDTFDNAIENILTATTFGNFCLIFRNPSCRFIDRWIGWLSLLNETSWKRVHIKRCFRFVESWF